MPRIFGAFLFGGHKYVMKIKMLTSCATSWRGFEKDLIYEVHDQIGKDFVKQGIAIRLAETTQQMETRGKKSKRNCRHTTSADAPHQEPVTTNE
jgi:hypothetical protein